MSQVFDWGIQFNFTRYHVGESMLPSLRHFLRFIDLDDAFLNHGFKIKALSFSFPIVSKLTILGRKVQRSSSMTSLWDVRSVSTQGNPSMDC